MTAVPPLAAVALGLVVLAGAGAVGRPVTSVRIVALNDFHGALVSPGAWNGRPVGGADYLAAYVARVRGQAAFSTVVGAGDLVGASPLVSAVFHDEGTVEVLNRIGLEFAAVGNHEFDDGQDELLRLQRGGCAAGDGAGSCQGRAVGTPVPFEGARFQYLAANVVAAATGEPLLPAYAVKTFRDPSGGRAVRIAFIGTTLVNTPDAVTSAGVAGLRFQDEAETVNALVPRLRREGIEAIVVLIHQGGSGPGDANACAVDAAQEPLRGIVAKLDDAVDLVVSGHSHEAYVCRMPNRTGRPIPVTQAGAFGRFVTDIELSIDDATGDVVAAAARNVLVDRSDPTVTPDPAVARIVERYQGLVAERAHRVVGAIAADVAAAGDEMPAGVMIADAQLEATRGSGAQIALMNRGGVRAGLAYAMVSGGEAPGEVTYGEVFAVQPFGNGLVTLTLSAKQLKDLLEQQFGGCALPGERAQPLDRMLQPSLDFGFAWDPGAPAASCSRIKRVTFAGAAVYDEARGGFVAPATADTRFRVTVNSFLAGGGDGFTVLRHATDPVGGGQDIDALVRYVAGFGGGRPAYDPASPSLRRPRITRVP